MFLKESILINSTEAHILKTKENVHVYVFMSYRENYMKMISILFKNNQLSAYFVSTENRFIAKRIHDHRLGNPPSQQRHYCQPDITVICLLILCSFGCRSSELGMTPWWYASDRNAGSCCCCLWQPLQSTAAQIPTPFCPATAQVKAMKFKYGLFSVLFVNFKYFIQNLLKVLYSIVITNNSHDIYEHLEKIIEKHKY